MKHSKLKSRKFWLTVAGMCAGIGTAISGSYTDSEKVIFVGIVCTAISACIYNICESLIDANAISMVDENDNEAVG